MPEKKQKLFAFWKYDTFPFVLGGEVEDFREDGLVYIESYQACFRPVCTVLLAEGKETWEKLEDLRTEFTKARTALRMEYLEKAEEIFGAELLTEDER